MRDYVCEYTYSPVCNKFKTGVLVGGCLAAALGMVAVSGTGGILAPYFKSGAAVWALAGVLFTLRLLGTTYVYSIFRDASRGEIDLVISEVRFGKSKGVCRVSLFDIEEIFEYNSSKKDKHPRPNRKKRSMGRLYNYCADVLPSRYCLLRISGNEASYIKFSPDETMLNIIKFTQTK